MPDEAITAGNPRGGGEIGRHVGRRGKAPVHAAEPSRAHEADPDGGRCGERASDRRRADGALDGADREIAWAELAGVRREPFELGGCEPDPDLPVEHADGRRNGACRPDGGLARDARRHAVWRREAVGDERRLERDDGALLLERRPHLVADVDQLSHLARAYRAVASSGHRARALDTARAGGESQLGPPDEPAGGKRVAGTGRVDDGCDRDGVDGALRRTTRRPSRA